MKKTTALASLLFFLPFMPMNLSSQEIDKPNCRSFLINVGEPLFYSIYCDTNKDGKSDQMKAYKVSGYEDRKETFRISIISEPFFYWNDDNLDGSMQTKEVLVDYNMDGFNGNEKNADTELMKILGKYSI